MTTREYYVYIMASRSRTLYTGMTNNLVRRVYEHKHKLLPGFTAKYNIDRLVYYERTSDVNAAIAREKKIKSWTRAKRLSLVAAVNPGWADLGEALVDGSGGAALLGADSSAPLRSAWNTQAHRSDGARTARRLLSFRAKPRKLVRRAPKHHYDSGPA
jgi:putative endonuclease